MVATALLKKSPNMKDLMAQVDPPKEATTVKKWVAGRYLTLHIKLHITLKNGRL